MAVREYPIHIACGFFFLRTPYDTSSLHLKYIPGTKYQHAEREMDPALEGLSPDYNIGKNKITLRSRHLFLIVLFLLASSSRYV